VDEAKLKRILAYVNLYLTVEFGIVPYPSQRNPEWTKKRVDAVKLAQTKGMVWEHENVEITVTTLQQYVRYGKMFWELTKACGMLTLVVLAVASTGATVIARENGLDSRHIPNLGCRLRNFLPWITACQALGPVVVEVLFTSSTRVYSMPECLSLIVSNPLLPAKYLGLLHREYLWRQKVLPPISAIGHHFNRPTLGLVDAAHSLAPFGIPPLTSSHPTSITSVVARLSTWLPGSLKPPRMMCIFYSPQISKPRCPPPIQSVCASSCASCPPIPSPTMWWTPSQWFGTKGPSLSGSRSPPHRLSGLSQGKLEVTWTSPSG